MALNKKLASLEVPTSEEKDPVNIKTLTQPLGYTIVAAKRVNTRFGHKCILLEVDIGEREGAVTFLPKSLAAKLDERDLATLVADGYKVRCVGTTGTQAHERIWCEEEEGEKEKKKNKRSVEEDEEKGEEVPRKRKQKK